MTLYLLGTPLGNLEDLVPRVARHLAEVEYLFAEDTRHSQKLLKHLGISRKIHSFHDHSDDKTYSFLNDLFAANSDIGYISDAGLPCICDPGYELVKMAMEHKQEVIPCGSASAVSLALLKSGLPPYPYFFSGFLKPKEEGLIQQLDSWKELPRPITVVAYLSPHRLAWQLKIISQNIPGMSISLVKELTKKFEQVIPSNTDQIVDDWLALKPSQTKGEWVGVIHFKSITQTPDLITDDKQNDCIKIKQLIDLLDIREKDACKIYATYHGGNSKEWYAALQAFKK